MDINKLALAVSIATCGVTAIATAQHADIRPGANCQYLVTNGWIDATSTVIPNQRVFGYDFQEDPDDPYFIEAPGFNTAGASALPAGQSLMFNVLNGADFGLSSNLSFWNGAGPVAFGALPGGETLTLRLGGSSVSVGGSLGEQAGFTIQTIPTGGAVHRHLSSILNGGLGPPANGIYLTALELTVTGLQDSLPFFLVYNNGLSEQVHDLAIDWVESSLVYLPGDLNRDHNVTAADIPAMISALVDLPLYQSTNQLSDAELFGLANLDGDCHVTNADLQALLNLLVTGGGAQAVPEPATLALALIGAVVGLVMLRRPGCMCLAA